MKKIISLILILVLFSVTVFGIPPVQTTTIQNEPILTIEYPKIGFYKLGTNPIKLHFHVYNSNGTALYNDTTSCLLHIYGLDGDHILEVDSIPFDSNTLEWKYDLNTSIIDHEGIYPYIVYCNNTETGFVSTYFTVNKMGITDEHDGLRMIALTICILGLMFFFIVLFFKLEQDHFILKLASMFFALILGIILPYVYVNVMGAQQVIYNIVSKFFYFFCIYLFLYLLYYWTKEVPLVIEIKQKLGLGEDKPEDER